MSATEHNADRYDSSGESSIDELIIITEIIVQNETLLFLCTLGMPIRFLLNTPPLLTYPTLWKLNPYLNHLRSRNFKYSSHSFIFM